jgi:hypothetical protein
MAIHTRGLKVETWNFGDGNKELEMERDPFKKKTSRDNEIVSETRRREAEMNSPVE